MSFIGFGPGAFRFILASLVVLEHLSRFQIGKVAVMAFFVLSGYWVTQVFEYRYLKVRHGILYFYLSRALRIWPLYLSVFFVAAVLDHLFSVPIPPDVWVALPILGVATHGKDIIGVTWSLDIELQFYLVLPLLVVFLQHSRSRLNWMAFFLVLLLFWAAGIALGIWYSIETVLIYLPLFLTGVVMYLFNQNAGQGVARISVLLFCFVAAAGTMIPVIRPYLLYGSGNSLSDKLFALVWVVTLFPFIAYNVRQNSNVWDRHLGNLSYAIYLVHFPLIKLARTYIDRDITDLEKLTFLPLVMVVSLVFYLVADLHFETARRAILRHLPSLPTD